MAKLRIRPTNQKAVKAAGGKVYDLKLGTLSAANKWKNRAIMLLVLNITLLLALYSVTN